MAAFFFPAAGGIIRTMPQGVSMRMSDKIDWWKQIFRWLQNALPFFGGFSFSAAMAYIRERRMGTRRGQSLGEAIMCGLLSVGTIRLIDWWFSRSGDAESWEVLAEFSDVMIGFSEI